MSKKLLRLEITGFVFVSLLGTLSHFFYEWSDYNNLVAIFCSVNESSWEHLKLLFFPYLLWTIAEAIMLKNKAIFPSKLVGIISGALSTLIFFFTYNGLIGKNVDFLNILSFFIGVAAAFLISYLLIKSGKLGSKTAVLSSVIVFIFISILFGLFTFIPPFAPLFRDPVNLSYGI